MTQTEEAVRYVFNEVKSKKEAHYKDLIHNQKFPEKSISTAWKILSNDYGLIRSINQTFFLTEKGETFDNVDEYLKSLKPIKKPYFTTYQIIYLPLFFLFGCFGVYQILSDSQYKDDYNSLRDQYNHLESINASLEEELNTLRALMPCDTSRTKKIDSLKNQ